MTQIKPLTIEEAVGPAKALLEGVKAKIGTVPNIFGALAQSPSTLEAYLGFSGSLGKGSLSAQLREQIALTVAGRNACDYCASAHTVMAKGAGVSAEEAKLNLAGQASDARTTAALTFANVLVDQRGRIKEEDVAAVREAGFTDGEIIEIVGNVAVNIFTNYFNHVAGTEVDFPLVSAQDVSRAA
ncbi:MAG: carboxymuconolactone decarboxylase family protein [Gammaproteobacteria bacterium]|nr:carboxymuconolactone decarboxylase family protein [Gammaproteobacteria bacterium]